MSSNESSATELYVAIGNPLRRDDGAAARVLEALKPAWCKILIQPTIELAAELAAARRVVFLDAAVDGEVQLEVLDGKYGTSGSHGSNPGEIVGLARRLYGFTGEAWLCQIPGEDFGVGEGLSPAALVSMAVAVRLLQDTLKAAA
jgi:hydrogenase maturation protease